MEKITLKPTSGRAVAFTGELIGCVEAETGTGRDTKLSLYRTARGKLVVMCAYHTCWQGERNSVAVSVYPDVEAMLTSCGTSRLYTELYDDAGIDTSIDADEDVA